MLSAQREIQFARRVRYLCVLACRAGATMFLIWGAVHLIAVVMAYVEERTTVMQGFAAPYVTEYVWMRALVPLGFGIGLSMGSAAISRWLAPVPELRCLRCDYDAEKSGSERCPECGAMLGLEFGEGGGGGVEKSGDAT